MCVSVCESERKDGRKERMIARFLDNIMIISYNYRTLSGPIPRNMIYMYACGINRKPSTKLLCPIFIRTQIILSARRKAFTIMA